MKELAAAVVEATDIVRLCDVKVEIDWYVDSWVRYATSRVANIDNIVKPILDAVSGVNGIIADDGQVQAVDVRWIDKLGIKQDFRLRVDPLSNADIAYQRQSLRFAEFGPSLCFPVPGNFTATQVSLWLGSVTHLVDARQQAIDRGASEYELQRMSPIQRFFLVPGSN